MSFIKGTNATQGIGSSKGKKIRNSLGKYIASDHAKKKRHTSIVIDEATHPYEDLEVIARLSLAFLHHPTPILVSSSQPIPSQLLKNWEKESLKI